jgi:hypothetical protein
MATAVGRRVVRLTSGGTVTIAPWSAADLAALDAADGAGRIELFEKHIEGETGPYLDLAGLAWVIEKWSADVRALFAAGRRH